MHNPHRKVNCNLGISSIITWHLLSRIYESLKNEDFDIYADVLANHKRGLDYFKKKIKYSILANDFKLCLFSNVFSKDRD